MVQVSLWVQPVGLSGLQQGKDRGTGVGTGLGVAEQPVLPADDNRADGVLHLVVADFDLTVVKEGAKVLPLVQGVGDSLLQLAGWAEDNLQPGVVLIDNGPINWRSLAKYLANDKLESLVCIMSCISLDTILYLIVRQPFLFYKAPSILVFCPVTYPLYDHYWNRCISA